MMRLRNKTGKILRERDANNKAITKSALRTISKPLKLPPASVKKANVKNNNVAIDTVADLPSDECINYDAQGRERLKKTLLDLNGGTPITFLHDNRFSHVQSRIQLAPVALLQKEQNAKFYGVYAKEDLEANLELGEYLGEILPTRGTDKDTNVDYSFDLENDFEVNAKTQRSWHAMVNGTSSPDVANVSVEKRIENKSPHIYYYLNRPIKRGEQLLIYYGDQYKFLDMRFLNPTDNWEHSDEKIKRHATYYKLNQTLPEQFSKLVGMGCKLFAVPDAQKITPECVDLPILAVDERGVYLPLCQQENVTLLHQACFMGDIKLAKKLLRMGANPNQQLSITGWTPLHFVILSDQAFEQKKELINVIMSAPNVSLRLQDRYERSILHFAVDTEQVDLITHLLDLNKVVVASQHINIDESLTACLNEKNQCYLTLAIEKRNMAVLNALKKYITKKEIVFYLNDFNSEPFVLALNNACQFSSPSEWRDIKQFIVGLIGTNDALNQSRLTALMPSQEPSPQQIVPIKSTISEPIKNNRTPVLDNKKTSKTTASVKFFKPSPQSDRSSYLKINRPEAVQRLGCGAEFVRLVNAYSMMPYLNDEEVFQWFKQNETGIHEHIKRANFDESDGVVKIFNLLKKFRLIRDFYFSPNDNTLLSLDNNPELFAAISSNWHYAFICAAFGVNNLDTFINNETLKQKTKQQLIYGRNDIEFLAGNLAMYAKSNVSFIKWSHENMKQQLKNKLEIVFDAYQKQEKAGINSGPGTR